MRWGPHPWWQGEESWPIEVNQQDGWNRVVREEWGMTRVIGMSEVAGWHPGRATCPHACFLALELYQLKRDPLAVTGLTGR